jgi:hypothetical protein
MISEILTSKNFTSSTVYIKVKVKVKDLFRVQISTLGMFLGLYRTIYR